MKIQKLLAGLSVLLMLMLSAAFAESVDGSYAVETPTGSCVVEFVQMPEEDTVLDLLRITYDGGNWFEALNTCLSCGKGHFVWQDGEIVCSACGTAFEENKVPPFEN